MGFKTKFVVIGGRSGVGKTTLIKNLMVLYPNTFKRPISYTTRARRNGEDKSEYIFISESKIKELHEQGKLANLDLNYGNYYAMDKERLIQDMQNQNHIIIKEIHPRYHGNIKTLAGEDCISVLIKGLDPEVTIRERSTEDDSYYETIKEDEFDLIFLTDKSSSPEENARSFYLRLMAYINTAKMFPSAKSIDERNAYGYSKVAVEFTEEKRITTRNFHEASKAFWSQFIDGLSANKTVLELGPGNGWLRSSFVWPPTNYRCVEISSNMCPVQNTSETILASARCIPVKSQSVDCVVASLADSYFYPEVLCEVNRILKDGAEFVVTLPNKEWADNLRGTNNHETSFLLNNGEAATVFSFTFSDEEIKFLAKDCGFLIHQLVHLRGIELRGNKISPAITCAAENSGKSIDDLNIITAMIWRKERDN